MISTRPRRVQGALAKRALETNRSVLDLVVEAGLLTRERALELLSVENLTGS